jgi:hypothetical protein
MAGSDFTGMSLNERLFFAGLLPSFDAAAKDGNRDALITLLGKVDLATQAPQIADTVLSRSDPGILGRRSFAPVRLNREGREVWSNRWGPSYMPCHWKGWALLIGAIITTNAALWLLIWLLHAPADDPRPFLVLPLGIIAALVLAERHSSSYF